MRSCEISFMSSERPEHQRFALKNLILESSANGISEFDIGLEVVSLSEATVQIIKYREFNANGASNENGEPPHCSGKFETTTGGYTDIMQTGTSVLDTTWSLIDPASMILKLDGYKELTAN